MRDRTDRNRRRMRILFGLLLCLFGVTSTISARAQAEQEGSAQDPAEARYFADLSRLLEDPNRLSGSPYAQKAADYVEQRLGEMGIKEVFPLEMPVWWAHTEHARLTVDGTEIEVLPLRPNVIIEPVTDQDGITAPLIYAADGSAERFGARSPQGAIVVLDYASGDGWLRAFALGARAVVFVGNGTETPLEPKHAGVPSNQPRFYLPASATRGVDLRRDHARATLVSQVTWRIGLGRNLVAVIPGTSPAFSSPGKQPEALVLATHLDSYGEVPEACPSARSAANVAAVLEAAQRLHADPPKRDVVLMFLDDQAHYHQGAREIYEALEMSEDTHQRLIAQHGDEFGQLRRMRKLLTAHGLSVGLKDGPSEVVVGLEHALSRQADYSRDDVRKRAQLLRLRAAAGPKTEAAGLRQAAGEAEARAFQWDELRRALHEDRLATFVRQSTAAAKGKGPAAEEHQRYAPLFEELVRATDARFGRRIAELETVSTIDQQRDALRRALGRNSSDPKKRVATILHLDYNFSDVGPVWGAVAGDWTHRLFAWRTPKPEGDNPGYYGRVLNALGNTAKELDGLDGLDRRTLADPNIGTTFAPGIFVAAGTVAGSYGLYHLSLMTGYDRRPRDGHPADSLAALNWRHLRLQAYQGTTLVRGLGDSRDLSLASVFKVLAKSKYPSYDDGQTSGDYVALQVSGSLKEDRPASGALLALWPGNTAWQTQAWSSLTDALQPPYFDPIALQPVDETGHFDVVGLRDDMHTDVMTLGALFDAQGRLEAITTQEKQAQKLTDAMRVNLFFGSGVAWSMLPTSTTQPQLLKVLNAASDSPFRTNRSLYGQLGDNSFVYVSDQVVGYRLKLFQPMGVAALGRFTSDQPYGVGLDPKRFLPGLRLDQQTAHDLWWLNESRLRQLRERGVTSADLETLHSRARRALDEAGTAASIAESEAALDRSAALSQHVYLPLRSAMDDLVHAIVLLLLLAIPFAFAMERLIICATTVYGKIAGFSAMFLGTFALLYWLHPGFAIAATPAIIFLAFAIVLLSALVIYIVIRKFKTELGAMQGRAVGVHGQQVSRMGTLLAAVSMGMSTMRRRPTRTALTAITVVMLTFTILSFASFSRTVGVRASYEGPANERTRAGLMTRRLDYSPIERGVLDMLNGQQGKGGLIAPHYWLVRDANETERVSVAHPQSGKSLTLDAVMGIPARELQKWPELAEALGSASVPSSMEALRSGGVFLPAIVKKTLGLDPGDWVLLNGQRLRFQGAFDSVRLERLRQLDGQSMIPVNFQDPLTASSGANKSTSQSDETQLILSEEVDRNFVHLSSDQVAIASPATVRDLGGDLYSIAIYPGNSADAEQQGRRLAELVVMPVWAAGADGIERLVFTVLTEVSGGLALFVPLLLGGLIIFGTLLGSISDREREIYTFSALGLGPGHVGALFFAEAAVYAVVGGMGGQLLSELVGLAAARLARSGVIEPTSINYSSTNSLFAIAVVMITVLVSAIYPAIRASRSANPGLARSWKMPAPDGDRLNLIFPFTVSAYDITGVLSFLSEHFSHHGDAGLGDFAASDVDVRRTSSGNLELVSNLALAPFDLGVTQHMTLTAVPSEIEGVDEVAIEMIRTSGTTSDWYRANRVFVKNLRRQFLLWRTLSAEVIEQYRMQTLEHLGARKSVVAEAS